MILTKSYQLVGEAELGKVYNSNKAYIRIYAKYNSQSISNNSSNVSLQARVYSESTWYSGKTTTYRITGSGSIDSGNISYTTSASDMYPKNAERTLGTITKDISHNVDGTRTIHAEANFYSGPWGWNVTASSGTTLELPAIPRYATSVQSLKSKSINTITMNWSSDNTIDYIWYSKDNGSTWTGINVTDGKSGSYTISGLSANTTYKIKTRVRRKDSQLTTDSSALSVTTYDYAKISSATNFNDEENPSMVYSNPYGSNVTSLQGYITDKNNTINYVERTISKTATSYVFELTDEERKTLQKATKDSNILDVRFYIKTTSNSKTYLSYVSKQMTIINGNPIFNDFDWETTNYHNLTGDNKSVIKGFSSIKTTIIEANKASSKKEATIKSYQTVVGTKTKTNSTLTYPVEITVNNVDGLTISVFANDSRGLSTKVEKPISNFIDVNPITIKTMSVERDPNNDEEVTLKVEGTVDTVDFGNVTNAIDRSRYYYAIGNSTDYKEGNTNLQFTYETINDTQYKFFINQIIEGDIENGFSSNGEYKIKVTISDKLTEVTKEKPLEQGSPALAFYGNSLSVGAPYNEDKGGRFQIQGEDYKRVIPMLNDFIELPDGTDLNDITEYGTYRSKASAHTATMTNVPVGVTGGFALYVLGYTSSVGNTNHRKQEVKREDRYFVRYTSDEGVTWTEWECMANYKIGDILITNTNTNPAGHVGGTWELVDKDLSYFVGNINKAFTAGSVLVNSSLICERTKDSLRFRLQIETIEGLADGTNSLGTVDYTKVGISGSSYANYSKPVFCDGGNTILCVYITGEGVIEVRDTMVKGGASTAPACSGYIDWIVPATLSNKMNSFCDKFYWKRTA